MTLADVALTIVHRFRDDYIGRDRRAEYAALLRSARDAGYDLVPLADFHSRRTSTGSKALLVLRHDVDIRDVSGNERFVAIERSIGARSTFYFRQSTAAAHGRLIRELLRDGFEVGYHFEEPAALAKQMGLRSRMQVVGQRPAIEAMFRKNCATFRRRWNPDLVSVASHGDWINRRLRFENHELITPDLLAECGLLFEAYGDDIVGRADVYVSDVARSPARWARDYSLEDALREARNPIYLLTHDRNWFTDRRASAESDLDRLGDDLRYRLRRRKARR